MKSILSLMLILLVLGTGANALAVEGERRQSLDGVWQFSTTSAAPENWDSLSVPGNWDTQPAYATHKGKAWYRREFTSPKEWAGKHIRLRFEAVYHDATVTLNGTELGNHSGGYTPFEFDVTDKLKPGATNTLVVLADNTVRRGAWWHWGGISRSVNLIANHHARIVWQHIRSEPDLIAGTARIFVRYKLTNTGTKSIELLLASAIDGAREPAFSKQVTIPARGETIVDLETNLPKERVRLWDFDHPNLYQLTTRLALAGKVLHEQTDRFGIRKIELTKDSLLLNGERVRLCGFNRVSDSREAGNTEPDSLVKQDVDLMKRANGNLTRLMHYPQAPNLLDDLDEKGMLIWCEIPVWGRDDSNTKTGNLLTRQWMTEMIERDYNHPCIIGWSVGNEMEKHFDYTREMMDFTRALDPQRIITHVSFTGARGDHHPKNDPISISDINLYNTYSPNENTAATLHAKWPEKPIFFSEFGIKQFGGNLDARIEGLEEMFRIATEGKPYVIGVSLWTYNDYRSDYEHTPPSGNREWGVVDVQRRPKAAYEQARKLFSPVHALSLEGKTVSLHPRGPEEVPSFTLRGYELRWSVSDPGGKALKSGTAKLPDLKPGSPVWLLKLDDAPSGALEVRLFTPSGYDVADLKGDF